jgi:tripartite-type tricarboxylate transporter receptor subunit TctC
MELVYSQQVFGRPYILPPGVPADRVAALRAAFVETLRDPELLAVAEAMKLDISLVSGEELQKKVEELYSAPPDIVERAKRALAAN